MPLMRNMKSRTWLINVMLSVPVLRSAGDGHARPRGQRMARQSRQQRESLACVLLLRAIVSWLEVVLVVAVPVQFI
jgi:hypothetical protein